MHEWKGLYEDYSMETQKFDFSFHKKSKLNFGLWLSASEKRNHPSFVNIYSTVVHNASMERSLNVTS